MSTNDPNGEYLKMIGAEVLRQQEEARQAAYDRSGGGMTLQQQQALKNLELERAAARREQDRAREAALAKDVAFEAERQKQREDREREAAKQQELDWRTEALVAWKAAGNSLYAFDLAWPDLLKQRRLTHMEEYQAKLRSGAARNAL